MAENDIGHLLEYFFPSQSNSDLKSSFQHAPDITTIHPYQGSLVDDGPFSSIGAALMGIDPSLIERLRQETPSPNVEVAPRLSSSKKDQSRLKLLLGG